MLRIPNPGSDISSFITIYCELYEALSSKGVFGLDDISEVLVRRNLATSSGYMGDEALQRSTRDDRSRDPLYNQSKMYAELFRVLGWFHSTNSALQFTCTYLGAHVLEVRRNPRKLFNECALGIAYPNAVLNVVGNYIIRPFAVILRTLAALDGLLCRDELIVGPLSLENDRNQAAFEQMISRLRLCRKVGWTSLNAWVSEVSAVRKISTVTMGNYTRFPLAVMRWSGWAYDERRKDIYGRSIPFLVLSEAGRDAVLQIENSIDIRAAEVRDFDEETKTAFSRIGFFDLLERAGFATEPFQEMMQKNRDIVEARIENVRGKQLLFSPFQELSPSYLASIFPQVGANMTSNLIVVKPSPLVIQEEVEIEQRVVTLVDGQTIDSNDLEKGIRQLFMPPLADGLDIGQTIEKIFSDLAGMNKGQFYPLVASMFRTLGFECQHSRAGVNYDRADAFIVHPLYSIPIEIKSPGEEEFISVKAVRQALENKVILLSRRAYPTERHITSLVVGYNLPNDRSEVTSLISDIYTVFDINIGVLDLRSLLYIVALKIVNGKTINFNDLSIIRGIIDVHNTSPETE